MKIAPKPAPVDPEILRQRRQEMAKRLVEMNAKKREEKLHEDESMLKILNTCLDLLDQGYEDKVKRMLVKHEIVAKNGKELQAIIDKTKLRIEKARSGGGSTARKKPEKDEPEAKKRREDMNEDEKREFDSWLDEVKSKRQELVEKRTARHFRKQQLTKRYLPTSFFLKRPLHCGLLRLKKGRALYLRQNECQQG